ncbi:MAG: HAMP domain-containing sensor histidine kinase [Acetobacter okinawensis]|uniref:sensor histidine kinase n=2 Tax=Acetobacter okinawensis TaxID=1076594 RepID=UPI0039E803D2
MKRHTRPSAYQFSIFKSSSFRIMSIFTGCFVISGLCVMAISGYHSLSLLTRQMQKTVSDEREEALSQAGIHDIAHMRPVMTELVRNGPGFYYLLQDAQEHIVVGNMLHLKPTQGWRNLTWTHRSLPPEHRPVIGYGLTLQDGGYLFVGIDAEPVQTLRRDLWFTFIWGMAGFIIIGAGGGLIVSHFVLGKIETISQTARDIMHGDMSRRLALNTSGDEFDHLATSLNAMLEKNECLITSLHQVTDDIAHDMRRPLAHLGQHLDEAMQQPHSPSQADALSHAKTNLNEALEIFSSLLKLAQMEAGADIPDNQNVSLRGILLSITDIYRPIMEEKQQTLSVYLAQNEMTCSGNKVLLVQMFSNLLENATNHCPAGSTIVVSSFMSDTTNTIIIADNGPGIPEHERERVFEKMVRLDHSRSIPGTGLGLSLVKAIVRLHHGRITLLDNAPGLYCKIQLPYHSKK